MSLIRAPSLNSSISKLSAAVCCCSSGTFPSENATCRASCSPAKSLTSRQCQPLDVKFHSAQFTFKSRLGCLYRRLVAASHYFPSWQIDDRRRLERYLEPAVDPAARLRHNLQKSAVRQLRQSDAGNPVPGLLHRPVVHDRHQHVHRRLTGEFQSSASGRRARTGRGGSRTLLRQMVQVPRDADVSQIHAPVDPPAVRVPWLCRRHPLLDSSSAVGIRHRSALPNPADYHLKHDHTRLCRWPVPIRLVSDSAGRRSVAVTKITCREE